MSLSRNQSRKKQRLNNPPKRKRFMFLSTILTNKKRSTINIAESEKKKRKKGQFKSQKKGRNIAITSRKREIMSKPIQGIVKNNSYSKVEGDIRQMTMHTSRRITHIMRKIDLRLRRITEDIKIETKIGKGLSIMMIQKTSRTAR